MKEDSTWVQDPKGPVLHFVYDSAGRLTSAPSLPVGGEPPPPDLPERLRQANSE